MLFTIAILAGIESLLSATVADGMSGDRHNSSMELVAQGIAKYLFRNVLADSLQPVAIARTATNIRAGAYSPFSGIIHAVNCRLVYSFFWHRLLRLFLFRVWPQFLIVVAWEYE